MFNMKIYVVNFTIIKKMATPFALLTHYDLIP